MIHGYRYTIINPTHFGGPQGHYWPTIVTEVTLDGFTYDVSSVKPRWWISRGDLTINRNPNINRNPI